MALLASVHATPLFLISVSKHNSPVVKTRTSYKRLTLNSSSLSSSSPSSTDSNIHVSSTSSPSTTKVPSSNKPPPDKVVNYAVSSSGGSPVARFLRSTESNIERVIFDFRFLALLAVAGSLAGSLLCFLNGCVYIVDAYKVYWSSCSKGIHTGQMVLRLVEAIDVYLAGTVMLIFGMGLYGLFISNIPNDGPPATDRALKGSSLFGMFALKERPLWMKISSLDELKTKVGHVIVMILLVKMFERSKMVTIATGLDLLSYSVCIFLSSASLYILHNLHKGE
ncbi:Golgi apparatus membrane protein [Heracleum sosnowskyi]|uniref:Golgi apparatus membrane protein n=1 Tax=Heracleum sosnowskyi TaxID=360622 RepID=A0AAD8JB80_9APIA|nr:Golgi apparatus membrane protein [Heracleum sosnowskyi]